MDVETVKELNDARQAIPEGMRQPGLFAEGGPNGDDWLGISMFGFSGWVMDELWDL